MGQSTKTSWTDTLKVWAKAPQRRDRIKGVIAGIRRLVPRNRLTLTVVARGAGALGLKAPARAAEARLLQERVGRTTDLTELLRLMGALEPTLRAAPLEAGRRVADLICTEEGRADLLPAALAAREAEPDSAWLTHVITLCQAMAGDYRTAGQDLAARLAQPFDARVPLERSRFETLRNSWRVTDQAAREQMDWIDEDPEGAALVAPAPTLPGEARPLGFKEHLLQGRKRQAYLAACTAELTAAPSLEARLKAIGEMIRPSLRHSPSYGPSYAVAREHFSQLEAEIEPLFEGLPLPGAAEKHILLLGRLLGLSRKLGEAALAGRCLDRLEMLAEEEVFLPVLWTAPAEMAEDSAAETRAARVMDKIRAVASPKTSRDVRGLFRWALLAEAHDIADASFAALPASLRRHNGVLHYVQSLIRRGRLTEAMDLLTEIHGQILTHPSRLNAFASRSMIKRRGELAFLIRTAEILGDVSQPKEPKGVLLLTARNLDHLRRMPLMVLRRMKAEGWALVPLVSGLLPPEPTGRADIDRLHGAISPNIRLSSDAEAAFPALTGFEADLSTGSFTWDGLALSHPLWEDAAIARRRYHIDWSCPELQSAMGNLVKWTKAMGRALDYAKGLDVPVASLVILPARLPDAAVRLYCEAKGDADGFFCLHGANGYQNYFTNFATNVSERYVIRNLTAHPETRAAAMPVPENFERYYGAATPRLDAIRARFAATPATPRSTEGKGRPPEAEALLGELSDWRARGGKIACAFGKVVCDSSVPFDGGLAHASMEDWIQHACAAVDGSNTLLLVKPHPHELNNRIATFPTEYFADLLPDPLPQNVRLLGHRWFDIADIAGQIDLGLIYNGTTAVELGLLGVPCLLSGHFAPIDYPIGHVVPKSRDAFEAYLRFERPAEVAPDLADRAAVWLDYMAAEDFTLPYRYHVRTVTNTVLYPPWWYDEDLAGAESDPAIAALTDRALNRGTEPGSV